MGDDSSSTDLSAADWEQIMAVRTEVARSLELLRKDGGIGSGLDAEVDLYCDDSLVSLLGKLEDELRFVLITSYARIHPLAGAPEGAIATEIGGLQLQVIASKHEKCVRCWHHREDVGSDSDHPELCGRCVENVTGSGEQRLYA